MPRPNSPNDICNIALDYLKQAPLNNILTPVSNSEFIFSRWYDIERQAALRAHPWKFAIKRATLTPTTTPPPFGYLYAYNLPSDYIRKVTVGNDYYGNLKQKIEIENGQILAEGGSDTQWNPGTNPASPAIPSWNLLTNYVTGNQVVYSGYVYQALSNNEGQEPDLWPGVWQQISTPNPNNTTPSTLYLRYIYDFVNVAAMDSLFIKFFALGMAIDLSPKFSMAATAVDRLMKVFEEAESEARSVNGQDNPPKRIQQSRILQKRRGYQYNIFAGKYTEFGY
jgi:hypothetical protein